MAAKITALGLAVLLTSTAFGGLSAPASAESFVEHSSEVRMQLDFVVPAAALAKFVPEGFDMNVATQGPAKDCNVRMIFIDRVDITKQDGSPADPGQGTKSDGSAMAIAGRRRAMSRLRPGAIDRSLRPSPTEAIGFGGGAAPRIGTSPDPGGLAGIRPMS